SGAEPTLRRLSAPVRRLAGELGERLADTGDLLGGDDEITVGAVGSLGEGGAALVVNRDTPGGREVEVAAVGVDAIEHAGQVPAGALVRRRLVEDVALGQRVVVDVIIVLQDAL